MLQRVSQRWLVWSLALFGLVLVACAMSPSGASDVGQASSALVGTLSSITVTPSSASLPAGATLQLAATGTYSGGTRPLKKATWTSENPAVASVSAKGLVTSVSPGIAVIRATDPATNVSGVATLNVTSAALMGITLSAPTKLPIGVTEVVAATGLFSDGSTASLAASGLTWSSSAPTVGAITTPGQVTGVSTGTTTVRATSGALSASVKVTVSKATLSSLNVAPTAVSIPLGETQAFTATGMFSDGSTWDLTTSVIWALSSGATGDAGADGGPDSGADGGLDAGTGADAGGGVVTIGPDGVATALGLGTSIISATFSSVVAFATITVTPAVVTAIRLIPSSPSFSLGTTEIIVAVGTYSDGTTLQAGGVIWTSSDSNVLTVAASGRLASVAIGTATVTATDPTTGVSASVTVIVTGPPMAVVALSHGAFGNSCAVLQDGRVRCWGQNESGQLGTGDTANRGSEPGEMGDNLPALSLGTGRTVLAVTQGMRHACALLDRGEVKCWGSNQFGQLGLGDTNSRGGAAGQMGDGLPVVDLGTGRFAKVVSAGGVHTCAVLDNGSVKCWGGSIDLSSGAGGGQLGLGDATSRGDEPGEMGDGLPAVDLGAGRTAKTVVAGHVDTCAILDDDSIKCWGVNYTAGQLGLGDTGNRGADPGTMGDNLKAVDLGNGRTARSVSPGNGFTCAILDDSSVKCWGEGGLLGLGNMVTHGNALGTMGENLPTVDLGTGLTAVALATTFEHACAVLSDSKVKCWGLGFLGYGDGVQYGTASGQMGDVLPFVDLGAGRTVTSLAMGQHHTCALLDNAKVKCWGYNGGAAASATWPYGVGGLLGLDDPMNRGDMPGEMGDALPFLDLGH